MKTTSSISITNLETGEVYPTELKLPDNKFGIKGFKMYNNGVLSLLDTLTKAEIKQTINLFTGKTINYYNVLAQPFHKLTSTMSKAARSRYKRKLLDGNVILEYRNKIMLNPFIFNSRGDKNIRNCVHLTQQVWKYMIEDCTMWSPEIEAHAELMFGEFERSDFLVVGSGDYKKLINTPNLEKPNSITKDKQ